MGAQQIPGSLGELWSCLYLEVQVGVYTFIHPAPRLCFTMPADTVCGPAGCQPRAQGCGRKASAESPRDGDMSWATGNGAPEPDEFGLNNDQCPYSF